MSRRPVDFSERAWSEVQALPQVLRRRVLDVVSHLADEPVPTLADPFPDDGDPLPGAYELHLPADGVTIWYVVFVHQGIERISIQAIRADRG